MSRSFLWTLSLFFRRYYRYLDGKFSVQINIWTCCMFALSVRVVCMYTVSHPPSNSILLQQRHKPNIMPNTQNDTSTTFAKCQILKIGENFCVQNWILLIAKCRYLKCQCLPIFKLEASNAIFIFGKTDSILFFGGGCQFVLCNKLNWSSLHLHLTKQLWTERCYDIHTQTYTFQNFPPI